MTARGPPEAVFKWWDGDSRNEIEYCAPVKRRVTERKVPRDVYRRYFYELEDIAQGMICQSSQGANMTSVLEEVEACFERPMLAFANVACDFKYCYFVLKCVLLHYF